MKTELSVQKQPGPFLNGPGLVSKAGYSDEERIK
jgi:hypothetical protein